MRLRKKDLGKVIAEVFKRYDADQTAEILDQIKSLGFEYSTVAGYYSCLVRYRSGSSQR